MNKFLRKARTSILKLNISVNKFCLNLLLKFLNPTHSVVVKRSQTLDKYIVKSQVKKYNHFTEYHTYNKYNNCNLTNKAA